MKGDKQIISVLNEVLTFELTSINQYFLHAKMYKNWGFENLSKFTYKKSIKDMKQADELIERVLFLEGIPNLQLLGKLMIGEETTEMLSCDMTFQQSQIPLLKKAISLCEELQDFVSRDLFEGILKYEEDHIDWIETQQYQITHMGIENYLQSQLEED
ncbi:MAG: bacterioferritin [Paraglaciecola sp.]|uniref:bacterioferritin n=1 Tax=Paraglaciecola sp. TaxID=1920173 RepID=UPI0032635C57